MRRLAFTLIAFLSLSGLALAHGGVEHVRGIITQTTDKAITIQTTGKQTKTITLLADTTFVKSGVVATLKDVNVGDKVVVDVVMKGKDMVAKAVKFGSVPTAKGAANHVHKTAQR